MKFCTFVHAQGKQKRTELPTLKASTIAALKPYTAPYKIIKIQNKLECASRGGELPHPPLSKSVARGMIEYSTCHVGCVS